MEAGLPTNAELVIEEIDENNEEYAGLYSRASADMASENEINEDIEANKAANEEAINEGAGPSARFFSIRLFSDGEELFPEVPVEAWISWAGLSEEAATGNPRIMHFAEDEGQEELDYTLWDIKNENGLLEWADEDAASGQAAVFSMEKSGIIGFINTDAPEDAPEGEGGALEQPFVTGDGESYEVRLTYGPEAQIPEGAALKVTEIGQDAEGYTEYIAKAAASLNWDLIDISYAKLLDISIEKDGEQIEPAAPVDVQIVLKDYGEALKEEEAAEGISGSTEGESAEDQTDVEGEPAADQSVAEGESTVDQTTAGGESAADQSAAGGDPAVDQSVAEGEPTMDQTTAGGESAEGQTAAGGESAADQSATEEAGLFGEEDEESSLPAEEMNQKENGENEIVLPQAGLYSKEEVQAIKMAEGKVPAIVEEAATEVVHLGRVTEKLASDISVFRWTARRLSESSSADSLPISFPRAVRSPNGRKIVPQAFRIR